jgi:hypothetical protein
MAKPMTNLRYCPDCGARPGQVPMLNCDMERCSVCAGQRLQCQCPGHDRAFARWLGQSPAEVFSAAMGIDIDEYFAMRGDDIFCIKPRIQDAAKVLPGTAEEKERAWAERHELARCGLVSARR